jgi:hypothetical protein
MEHIETEREQLGENLEEIESRFQDAKERIKDAADPRAWFEQKPALCLGVAAASGLIIGLLVTSRSSSELVDFADYAEPQPRQDKRYGVSESRHFKTIKNTLDTTIAALVGLGARKFQDFVSDSLPGFQEQYTAASQRQEAWDSADSKPSTTY